MANKIIDDVALPDNFKTDGEILYGRDINQIVSVLKTAANLLKKDIDTLLTGSSTPIVKYTLAELEAEPAVVGTQGLVYEEDGIKLYEKGDPNWVYIKEVSLIDAATGQSILFNEDVEALDESQLKENMIWFEEPEEG